MVRVSLDQMRELVGRPSNSRHITIISAAGGGITTLEDLLLSKAGLSSGAPLVLYDVHDPRGQLRINERDLSSTKIKPEMSSLYFELPIEHNPNQEGPFVINMVAFPDSATEMISALRMTDGALLLVDVFDGIGAQTEMMLRHVLAERVKPVLFINKVDRVLMDKLSDQEDLFVSFRDAIQGVNDIISMNRDPALGDVQVQPEKGTVVFGSGLQGWAFTLHQFARRYSKKFGVDERKMLKRLWGNHFFDPGAKSWTVNDHGEDGERFQRGFTHFVLDPIYKLFDAVLSVDKPVIEHILQKLGITLGPDEDFLEGKALLKAIMRKFLPATDALLETVVLNLPSPLAAQRYRAEILYDGPATDAAALSIKNCDPNGPLVVYISKLVPIVAPAEKGRFYAFGRVFSGTVRCGDKIRVQGPKYVPGSKSDLFIRSVTGVVAMHGMSVGPLEDCPAGSLVGIAGVDQFLVRSGTLTDLESHSHSIRTARYSGASVVQVYVDIKNAAHLPRLVEGLKQLSKSHPHVQTWVSESGAHIIGAEDEHQLEMSVKYLEEDVSIALTKSPPIISYRETVTTKSSTVAMSKSPNKKRHLFVVAMPLAPELATAIEDAPIGARGFAMRSRILAAANDWDADDARKIWCFGPDNTGPNVLVDATKGVPYLNELKDGVASGFQWATSEGVCAEEPLRAVRFDIVDYMHHSEGPRIMRGNGQNVPTARRVCYAACLLATPAIQEPVYLVEIQCPESSLAGVRIYLADRRGVILSEEPRRVTSLFTLRAHLPVSDSLGLSVDMRSYSATVHIVFDHWTTMAGSPLETGSRVEELVIAIRVRKGLKPQIPLLDLFLDKL
ncbi:eukaryotic translation elongation factor 2 [Mycena vulgaris]|nr:eukaryotic translation elongation factor 2 [Mycena vulgaris]